MGPRRTDAWGEARSRLDGRRDQLFKALDYLSELGAADNVINPRRDYAKSD